MQYAWSNYETHAFGADEIAPVSGERRENVWGGIGVTLVDSLDTLYLMDMHRARDWVALSMDFSHLGQDGNTLSVFEIVIRQLGGLLSAYDLSQDDVFKHRAVELADLLLPAFSNGVFYTHFNVHTQEKILPTRWWKDRYGIPRYAGHFATDATMITVGARGDSFYEYLLKVWLYSGKRHEDAYLRKLYDDAVDGMEKHLLVYSEMDDVYYLQELRLPDMDANPQQDHLLCFVPGMLALGTVDEQNTTKAARHLDLAKKLMHTCTQFYLRQPSGLAPDLVEFPGWHIPNSMYKLRPETVESLMYMFRITQDPIYREWGWTIFESLEQHAKTKYGYGAVRNVHDLDIMAVEDKMESFFLAETLKYHYLLQSSPSFVPLDEFVFNTEAHPLRIHRPTQAHKDK
ncbi:hypothetical protein DYB32_003010 [Aphanomyces invadans]|uniref:alpha-1,2-Mannosidase n=1 Tax=Aphanomyces invadans TaxID=157072 RepID=A0A418B1N8_9STRA|nr:hypothetical protein DYB32_003010 [Aphanomyces invadans]